MELDNHILETVKLKKCLLVKQLYKIYGEKMGVSYPTFIKRLRSIDSLRIGPLVSDSKVLFAYIDRRISFQKAVLGAMLQAYTELSGEDAWFAISSSALPGFYSSLIKNASNLNRNYLDILENDRAF